MCPNDVSKKIIDLNAGWYNVVTKAMKIQDPGFQLAQGGLGLQTSDSSGLFRMADSVPEPANVTYYSPSGPSRSAAYASLLCALKAETGSDLKDALGDMYSTWQQYFQEKKGSKSLAKLFEEWASNNLETPTAAIKVFKNQQASPIMKAMDALSDEASTQKFTGGDGQSYKLYKYSSTIDDARKAINNAPSTKIEFDSSESNKELKNFSGKISVGGAYKLFAGEASGSLDKLNTVAEKSSFTIKGNVTYATLNATPVNWYNSYEVTRAYNSKNDYDVWDPNAKSAGDWDSFFGTNGSLGWHVASLLLVSDYNFEVTSHASYEQKDIDEIKAKATIGIWPFFHAGGSANYKRESTINDNGNLVTNYTLNKGLIQIWGAIIKQAPY